MNAIESAVLPLKSDAVQRAEQEAKRVIDQVLADLEAASWDLDAVAPRPSGRMSRTAYARMMARYELFVSLTSHAGLGYRKPRDPDLRGRSPEREQRFIVEAKENAALQYDLFVAKLVEKVGEVASAQLSGSHVWGQSILTVEKADGAVERWKTQMIVNVSKLGKLFNQFPTRKMR